MGMCLVAVNATFSVAGDGINEWLKLRWGMTEIQVEQAYPSFETWQYQGPPINDKIDTYTAIGFQSYVALGCKFELKLNFLDNSYEGFALRFIGSDAENCRELITRALTNSYRTPSLHQPIFKSGSPSYEWQSGNLTVRLEQISDQVFIVSYSHTGAIRRLVLQTAVVSEVGSDVLLNFDAT